MFQGFPLHALFLCKGQKQWFQIASIKYKPTMWEAVIGTRDLESATWEGNERKAFGSTKGKIGVFEILEWSMCLAFQIALTVYIWSSKHGGDLTLRDVSSNVCELEFTLHKSPQIVFFALNEFKLLFVRPNKIK